VVIAAKPVLARVPTISLLWIAAGGLLYSLGVIFYIWKRLPYSHAVWHLFVLAGSACHYVAVFRSLLPHRV
jgi:hemolysin III